MTALDEAFSPTVHPSGALRNSISRPVWAALLLLLALSAIPFYYAIQSAAARIVQPFPQNPWESEILADAWRVNHGLPIYTDPVRGHATHMYGPLITYAVAVIMHFWGFHLAIGRWIALISSALLATGAALLMVRELRKTAPMICIIIGLVTLMLLLVQPYRTRAYHAETRPDAISTLFAAASVWLFYRGQTRASWIAIFAGIAMMWASFGFKQTGAMVAAVPPLALLLTHSWRRDLRSVARQWMMALSPPAAILLLLAAIHWLFPHLWFYLITVPGRFRIDWPYWPVDLSFVITHNGIFVAMLVVWLLERKRSGWDSPAARWLIAAVIVSALAGSCAFAKVGGSFNSLLPAYIAANIFSLAVLVRIVRDRVRGNSTALTAGLIALAAVLVYSDGLNSGMAHRWMVPGPANGGPRYASVIQRVRSLPGRVICMDDPTIPILAGKGPCRCIICEHDACGGHFPAYALKDLKYADYVVCIRDAWLHSPISSRMLRSRGFVPVKDAVISGGTYFLWAHRREIR